MIRRQYYGWIDQRTKTYRVSLYPPDAPVRPSTEYETKAMVMDLVERKRAQIMWWPPLPNDSR